MLVGCGKSWRNSHLSRQPEFGNAKRFFNYLLAQLPDLAAVSMAEAAACGVELPAKSACV